MFLTQRLTPEFEKALGDYRNRGTDKPIAAAITEVRVKPFGNPALETHEVKGAKSEDGLPVYTSKVDDGRRMIWTHYADTQVLVLLGEHDPIYRRAARCRIRNEGSAELVVSFGANTEPEQGQPATASVPAHGVLDFVTDAELVDAGIATVLIPSLRQIRTANEFGAVLEALSKAQANAVWDLLEKHDATAGLLPPSEMSDEIDDRVDSTQVEPDTVSVPEAEPTYPDIRVSINHLAVVPDLGAEQLRSWLARPIEDWMLFLDPAQDQLVNATSTGPTRISGPAGTGKTVVGLHRARASLATDPDSTVLVTTLVATLPKVLEQLYRRFDPDAGDRIEFVGLHAWAYRFLTSTGRKVEFRPERSQNALDAAIRAKGHRWARHRDHTCLRSRRSGVDHQGSGADLTRQLSEDLPRRPRVSHAAATARDHVGYCPGLQPEVASSGPDRRQRPSPARTEPNTNEGSSETVPTHCCRRSAGSLPCRRPPITGDRRQFERSAAPAGRRASIDLSRVVQAPGRRHRRAWPFVRPDPKLPKQSRNSRGSPSRREGTGAEDPLDLDEHDIDGEEGRVDDGLVALRSFTDNQFLSIGVEMEIDRLVTQGAGSGDIAVLVPTNKLVDEWMGVLKTLERPAIRLSSYEGRTTHHVKVGTYHRAKGLEFKHVLMPAVDSLTAQDARRSGEDDADFAERTALNRRRIYVAMTRARDSLWLGWSGQRSSLLAGL